MHATLVTILIVVGAGPSDRPAPEPPAISWKAGQTESMTAAGNAATATCRCVDNRLPVAPRRFGPTLARYSGPGSYWYPPHTGYYWQPYDYRRAFDYPWHARRVQATRFPIRDCGWHELAGTPD